MNVGFFISFEGPDGSGKSTQMKLLAKFLSERGLDVVTTREPGGTDIGERIRAVILDIKSAAMSDSCEMLLYAACRAQLVDEYIKPLLSEGKIVLCDRFIDSSLAYQGYGRGLGKTVAQINAVAVRDCMPDLTIMLQIDPEICFARKPGEQSDRIESEDLLWHRRVYDGYIDIAVKNPGRIHLIDADRGVHQIQDDIRLIVSARLDGQVDR